ncbi:MAG: hypothetical protein ABMA64_16635 [Myxococcota bacterium]
MAQWLVMQGNTKFPVGGLAELEEMARRGGIRPGDMIQPPGTTDWLYATEIPELKAHIERNASGDDDDDAGGGGSGATRAVLAAVAAVMAVGMVLVILVGGGIMLYFAGELQGTGGGLIGDGGLAYSEMIVTAPATGLRAEPADDSRVATPVAKDATLELLAKRGAYYRARAPGGGEGWIPIVDVIPMYQLGGADVRQEYDPLYNPDRYVDVANARWMQLPGEKPGQPLSNVTAFDFMLTNSSKYPMTDLKILATIKDAQGHELERVEIPIEGVVPGDASTFVGTLSSEPADESGRRKPKDPNAPPDRLLTTYTFDEMAKDSPELQLRFTSGVEVVMKAEAFANAEIDVLELRAVPDATAAGDVRR